jgi:hypothetical protein
MLFDEYRIWTGQGYRYYEGQDRYLDAEEAKPAQLGAGFVGERASFEVEHRDS